MSVLAPAPDFDTGDGFLHALLGLVAAAAAVRALAPSTSPPAQGSCAAVADGGGPALDAILGVLHLTSLASRVTSSWAAARGDVAPAPDLACASTPIEGLLR